MKFQASDNPMAAQLTALIGEALEGAWVLVEFDDGQRVVVRKASELRQVKIQ